jgi:hypothetical protein
MYYTGFAPRFGLSKPLSHIICPEKRSLLYHPNSRLLRPGIFYGLNQYLFIYIFLKYW